MLSAITPVILTFNEAPNLERTLSYLEWAERVVIVDSRLGLNGRSILRPANGSSQFLRPA
jgi:hypothetical protein